MASSAASLSCGETFSLIDRRYGGANNVPVIPRTRPSSLVPRRRTGGRSFKTMAISAAAPVSRREYRRDAVANDKIDEWMWDSVGDIVKNLREAPLMVQLYGGDAKVEKAVDWSEAKGRWEAGESPVPEGLIFVEELSERQGEEENNTGEEGNDDNSDGVTRAFGVVVQGKGLECSPVCYLLKTSTAGFGSGPGCGFGLGCTHFCLVRVSGFRETTESQLKNCWLLQAQAQGP